MAFSPSPIDVALSRLQPQLDCLPEDRYIERLGLNIPIISEPEMERLARKLGAAVPPDAVLDFKLAVDLDETLLFSSQIFPEIWQCQRGYNDPEIAPGYIYRTLSKTWKGRIAKRLGRPDYHCANVSRHPFMASPRLIVAPNIPLLSMLLWLRKKGAIIGMATASAKQRVEYLLERMPILSDIFGHRIMSARDLAERSILAADSPDQLDDAEWTSSRAVHQARPYSLMAKTPWALSPMFDGQAYDLIIDDSETTINLLQSHGMTARTCQPQWPTYTRASVWNVVADCLTRAFSSSRRVADDKSLEDFPTPISMRIEDPFYWPLLHHEDQFTLETGPRV